jgi:hypothetical protein
VGFVTVEKTELTRNPVKLPEAAHDVGEQRIFGL